LVASKADKMAEQWVSKSAGCLVVRRELMSVAHWAEGTVASWGHLTAAHWVLTSVDEMVEQWVSQLVA